MATYGDNQKQSGDVLLYQTLDDGEIDVVGGMVKTTETFDTMVYLSLFGGNSDDPGGDDESKSWWGNLDEPDPARQYRSETQNLLRSLPATASNLRRIEAAVTRDIGRDFITTGIASEFSAVASIPALNRVAISGNITADGERHEFAFVEVWEASVR